MEVILNRFRNLTALLVVIAVQFGLLGFQVKGNGEVRLIRVWAVGAVTPLARVIETTRGNVTHFLRDYFLLVGVRQQNEQLKADLDRARMENQFLHTEVSTADRAAALAIFQRQSPSKTIAAQVIGNTTGVGAKVVIIDRGSSDGVQKGMAVITPAGIVGKVTGAFPTASYVLLVTDPNFAAGVLSQQNRVHGTVKGQGTNTVTVDYVQNQQKVEPGEWFFTSGDDLIFPKGLPVGRVTAVSQGKLRKEVLLSPSGLENGLEEVLVVLEGVHADIPDVSTANQPVHLQDPPPVAPGDEATPVITGGPATDADRMVERYRKIGEAQNHEYGGHGGRAPNYNINLDPRTTDVTPAAPGTAEVQPAPEPAAATPSTPVKPPAKSSTLPPKQ